MSFLLRTRARRTAAATVAVVQLAMAIYVVVLEVIQDVPDVGRRRLLLVAAVVQGDPTTQVGSGVLLLPAAVFLIQIPGVVPRMVPHEALQLPIVEVRFPIGGRVGPLDLDVAGIAADVLPGPVVVLRWAVIVPGMGRKETGC